MRKARTQWLWTIGVMLALVASYFIIESTDNPAWELTSPAYAYTAAATQDVGYSVRVSGKTMLLGAGLVEDGETEGTIPLVGVTPGSMCFATPNTAGGASVLSAVAGTDEIVITMSAEVSGDTTICVMAWE